MGKKRNIVVISSSEEDDHQRDRDRGRAAASRTNYSLKSKSVASKKRQRPGRHLSESQSRTPEQEGSFDALCEDFYDGFQAGSRWNDKRELWVDKYKPRSLDELAVHKKKVEEVKMWLIERLDTSKDQNHTLVITGQAGVGKSTTIRVAASHLGSTICEWDTPTPTLWQEHIHNSSSGTHYMSKLDEFETFVEKTRKYSLLPFSSGGGSVTPLLLIDDLPLTNGKVARQRLCSCLHILAQAAQIPTVVLLTEYSEVDSVNNSKRHLEDIQSSLESAGACKIAFNPITVNSIKKALSRICREEQCNVSAEQIDQIAKASGGDIRQAITSLQYFCLRPDHTLSLSIPTTISAKDKSGEFKLSDDRFALSFGRDEMLSLFHALGKFLHNKRESEHASAFGEDVFLLSERFARLPLKMDAPEKILSQAHGQGRNIADFLHENVLDFLGEEAIDDAWDVASYLSDADSLLSTCFHGSTWQRTSSTHQPESVAQLAAASVAVRGVLFGNSHPGPSRWHAIRSPKLWHVEHSSRYNKNEMVRGRHEVYNGLSLCDMSVMATEYTPVLKWLTQRASSAPQVYEDKLKVKQMGTDWTEADDAEGETLEESEGDEIEDW